jgi:hypothetical protein
MSKAGLQLLQARAARNSARAVFDARTAQVKDDVEARGVGGRVADRLGEEAWKGVDQAIEVASESKLLIAAIAGALAAWMLRHPIMAWIEKQLGELQDREEVTDDD